jgi:predicted nuclease of restriction endonuclease-like RecB superfamily
LLYGRALGELVQFLPHCAHFKLRAECVLRDQEAILDVQSGDPIFPAEEPKAYDSKLEERFARDLKRAAPDWDLVREPEPVPAGRTLIFPDFLLRHRLCPQRSFFVEILGFWSADYLARKLALLREAGLEQSHPVRGRRHAVTTFRSPTRASCAFAVASIRSWCWPPLVRKHL